MLSWEKMAATLVIHRENGAKEKKSIIGGKIKKSPPTNHIRHQPICGLLFSEAEIIKKMLLVI